MESSSETFTTVVSKYWATERISRLGDFPYKPSKRPENSDEVEVAAEYTYKVPRGLGEGVIIYYDGDRCRHRQKIPHVSSYSSCYQELSWNVSQIETGRYKWTRSGAAPKAKLVAVYRDPSKADGLKTAFELIKTHYSKLEPRAPAIT
ncbi:MAG: hypothetical protein MMC33_007454 [Icmadophila ericetorum]|nr:hypothetical protein [Icmadophila ericetorum]